MSWPLFIIAIIVIIFIKKAIDRKIDESEREALATPGRADFLRNNYQDVISHIESQQGYEVIFERLDSIRIGFADEHEYIVLSNYSGGLRAAFVCYSSVVKEWIFKHGESSRHIIYELDKVR